MALWELLWSCHDFHAQLAGARPEGAKESHGVRPGKAREARKSQGMPGRPGKAREGKGAQGRPGKAR